MTLSARDESSPANSWTAKFKRTMKVFLPIAENRSGECNHCGKCCRLPSKCPFLKLKSDGVSYCAVYFFRPPNCRKYPRHKSEWLTKRFCGYKFN